MIYVVTMPSIKGRELGLRSILVKNRTRFSQLIYLQGLGVSPGSYAALSCPEYCVCRETPPSTLSASRKETKEKTSHKELTQCMLPTCWIRTRLLLSLPTDGVPEAEDPACVSQAVPGHVPIYW